MIPTWEEVQTVLMSWDLWEKVLLYGWVVYREWSNMKIRKEKNIQDTDIAVIRAKLEKVDQGQEKMQTTVETVARVGTKGGDMIQKMVNNSKLPQNVKDEVNKDWNVMHGTHVAYAMEQAKDLEDNIEEGLKNILPKTGDSPIIESMIEAGKDVFGEVVEEFVEQAPEIAEKVIDTVDDLIKKG